MAICIAICIWGFEDLLDWGCLRGWWGPGMKFGWACGWRGAGIGHAVWERRTFGGVVTADGTTSGASAEFIVIVRVCPSECSFFGARG